MGNDKQNAGAVISALQAGTRDIQEQARELTRTGNSRGAAELLTQGAHNLTADTLDYLQGELAATSDLLRLGRTGGAATDDLLDKLAGLAARSRVELSGSDALFTQPAADDIVAEIERADEVIPLPYPVEVVDTAGTWGLSIPRGAITVIAGATGHGKTTLLIDIASRIAGGGGTLGKGQKVLYLTNEQTRGAIYTRIARRVQDSTPDTIRAQVDDDSIIVNECGGYDSKILLAAIDAGLQRASAESRPGVVIVDWLQMISGEPGAAASAETYRLRDLMAGLNKVALDTGTAIITAAQLNRQAVNPARVALDSMGDSIGISQMAAKVIGIWNCSKWISWGSATGKGAWDAEKNAKRGAPGYTVRDEGYRGLYMRVLKERHGRRTGGATLTLDAGRAIIGGKDSGRELVEIGADEVDAVKEMGKRTRRPAQ